MIKTEAAAEINRSRTQRPSPVPRWRGLGSDAGPDEIGSVEGSPAEPGKELSS